MSITIDRGAGWWAKCFPVARLEAHTSVCKRTCIGLHCSTEIPTVPFSRCRVHFARFSNARKWKGDRSRDFFAISDHCSVENPLKMTSEKTDVIYPTSKKTKFEQLRADHELFLQAFESKFCRRCYVFRADLLKSTFSVRRFNQRFFRFQNQLKSTDFFALEMLSRWVEFFVLWKCPGVRSYSSLLCIRLIETWKLPHA